MAKRAIILANGDFADTRIPPLKSPVSDGKRMKSLLERSDVGGYEVVLCADCDAGAIKIATERFFSAAEPDDLLLMLVSGHGQKDRRGNLHFIARDTIIDALAATAVEARFFHNCMRDSRATKQIVFVDTCFSGAFSKDANFKSLDIDVAAQDFTGDAEAVDEDEGIAIFTASAGNQLAQEKASECGLEGVQSQFTRHIIEGIETGQADPQGTGWITLENLFTYARRGLKKDGIGQTPQRLLSRLPGSVQLARNPVALAELPDEIDEAIHSQDSLVRASAVDRLMGIANGPDQTQKRLAIAALRKLSFDETVLVTTAAERALARLGLQKDDDEPSHDKQREEQEQQALQLKLLESERLTREKSDRDRRQRDTEEEGRQQRHRAEEAELGRKRQELEAREQEAKEREKQRRKRIDDIVPEPETKSGFPTWLKWAGGAVGGLAVIGIVNGAMAPQPEVEEIYSPPIDQPVMPEPVTPEPDGPAPVAEDSGPPAPPPAAAPTPLSLVIAAVAAQERAVLPIALANDWRITAVRTTDTAIVYDTAMDVLVDDAGLETGRPAARAVLAVLACASPGLVQVFAGGGSATFNITTGNGMRFSETIRNC